MERVVPKNASAIIVTEDPESGFIDIQIVYPEGAIDGDRTVATVNLAESLLESTLFGYDWDEEKE